jgi:hypothetical protein
LPRPALRSSARIRVAAARLGSLARSSRGRIHAGSAISRAERDRSPCARPRLVRVLGRTVGAILIAAHRAASDRRATRRRAGIRLVDSSQLIVSKAGLPNGSRATRHATPMAPAFDRRARRRRRALR